MSEHSLVGRKALVTGGARGIGAAIASTLAQAGAAVMIADTPDQADQAGQAAAAALSRNRAEAGFVPLDVADELQWQHAVTAMMDTLGGFDLLINNASVGTTGLVTDIDAAGLRHMCEVNIIGTALGMKHAFRAMRPGGIAGRGGTVINIASVAAGIAFPAIAGYSGTRSAVQRMTRIAAMEACKLGYGVRVNCIHPGMIATATGLQLAADIFRNGLAVDAADTAGAGAGQMPMRCSNQIIDATDAALRLSLQQARFATGAGLPVDGGTGI